MQPRPLTGKVAIVTGAGSPIGLGRAMTLALVQAGARVAMLDVNKEWLEETASDVREVGGDNSVLTLVCDVADHGSAERAVRDTIAGLGGLHILINNAGIVNPSGYGGDNNPNENMERDNGCQQQWSILYGQSQCRAHDRPKVGQDYRSHNQRRFNVSRGNVSIRPFEGLS